MYTVDRSARQKGASTNYTDNLMGNRGRGGGHCVLKWILWGHFKPPLNATIEIVFEVIFIRFW